MPGPERLRLSSIDSIEADDDLMRRHRHGDAADAASASVAAVGRRHDPEAHEAAAFRADAIGFCEDVRQLRPDIVFGADIIAGFPTETDEMFENSLRIVEECGLTICMSSRSRRARARRRRGCRSSTRASCKERAARLRAAGEAAIGGISTALAGTAQSILVERDGLGRTEDFTLGRDRAGAPGEIVAAHDHRP